MKKMVCCICLTLCLLCACAPRAREYSAVATAQQTVPGIVPTQSKAQTVLMSEVQTKDPPARFTVPAGWSIAVDAGLYQLSRSGLDAYIEFSALPRIHPDYTYKKELSALKASVKRTVPDAEITYENGYLVEGEYSGIELLYTHISDAGREKETVHIIIFFEEGNEYDFVLTASAAAFVQGELALKEILYSLEIG